MRSGISISVHVEPPENNNADPISQLHFEDLSLLQEPARQLPVQHAHSDPVAPSDQYPTSEGEQAIPETTTVRLDMTRAWQTFEWLDSHFTLPLHSNHMRVGCLLLLSGPMDQVEMVCL